MHTDPLVNAWVVLYRRGPAAQRSLLLRALEARIYGAVPVDVSVNELRSLWLRALR